MIAVVGVGGTLGSALLTQRYASKLKRLELESAERQQAAAQAFAARQEADKVLRACFVSVTHTLRSYNVRLRNYHRALARESTVDTQAVEEAREAVRAALAEAQMLAPHPILEQSRECAAQLYELYRELMSAERQPGNVELLNDISGRLLAMKTPLESLRTAMRDHLSTAASPGEPPEH